MDHANSFPTLEELTAELSRVRKRKRRVGNIATIFCVLATVFAAVVLIIALWFPIVEVYDDAMAPTFPSGSLLVAVDTGNYAPGDIIAFYHNNSVYVRRIAATPGSLVNMNDEGIVTVNGQVLDESYVSQISPGQCDMEFPLQLPDGCYFVLGDNRENSIDSRSSVMGFVSEQRILGRILFCIRPSAKFGSVE